MISKRERKFKSSMIGVIERHIKEPEKKYELLKEFYENEEYYYDLFCDLIYLFLVDEDTGKLYIDMHGITHIDEKYSDEKELLIQILSQEDFDPSCSDIGKYIDIALRKLDGE